MFLLFASEACRSLADCGWGEEHWGQAQGL